MWREMVIVVGLLDAQIIWPVTSVPHWFEANGSSDHVMSELDLRLLKICLSITINYWFLDMTKYEH